MKTNLLPGTLDKHGWNFYKEYFLSLPNYTAFKNFTNMHTSHLDGDWKDMTYYILEKMDDNVVDDLTFRAMEVRLIGRKPGILGGYFVELRGRYVDRSATH